MVVITDGLASVAAVGVAAWLSGCPVVVVVTAVAAVGVWRVDAAVAATSRAAACTGTVGPLGLGWATVTAAVATVGAGDVAAGAVAGAVAIEGVVVTAAVAGVAAGGGVVAVAGRIAAVGVETTCFAGVPTLGDAGVSVGV
ncbi:hypothetical protein [Mycolicibacterium llatzerense]|uniref:hypothetical protein n=1 Tax=Mycolicibacterium llatzerense TaxID=280871 RepID=UPI0013A6A4D5|nr:hypothetical protein [Mycolicibacterium llatzerense]